MDRRNKSNSELDNNLTSQSDILESQSEVPGTNIPIPSTNPMSSQLDNFRYFTLYLSEFTLF